MNEGRPNVADEIVNGKIDLIINTPLGRESFFDDRAVRRVAMMQGVPCITTLTGASAAVAAIRVAPHPQPRRAGAAGLLRGGGGTPSLSGAVRRQARAHVGLRARGTARPLHRARRPAIRT